MVYDVNMYNLYNEIQSSQNLLILDFWAPWCMPCKMLTPLLDQISQEYSNKVKFLKVNIDAEPAVANTFNISSIPTLVFIKNQKVVDIVNGFIPKKNLQKIINKNL